MNRPEPSQFRRTAVRRAPWRAPLSVRIGWYTGPRLPNGCREWTGTLDNYGYALTTVEGDQARVGRVLLGLNPGDPRIAMHVCDNPMCVEPAHLHAGTHKDNAQDREQKGRGSKVSPPSLPGDANPNAKLTTADVLHIRASSLTHKELATRLKVTAQLVRKVRRREVWRHLQ